MKRYRGFIFAAIVLTVCAGVIYFMLRDTEEYPTLGSPVTYKVNQMDGFHLSIEAPSFSPFKGYTIRYKVDIDSNEVYYLDNDSKQFEFLEYSFDGQWYRLDRQGEFAAYNIWDIGGEDMSSFEGSLVQKYDGYGTRLESGLHRLTLELTDQQGELHYLAAEFSVS